MDYNMKEVMDFLSEPRSRKDICNKFELNNMQSYRLVRWLTKGGFVTRFSARIEGQVGQKGYFYLKK